MVLARFFQKGGMEQKRSGTEEVRNGGGPELKKKEVRNRGGPAQEVRHRRSGIGGPV